MEENKKVHIITLAPAGADQSPVTKEEMDEFTKKIEMSFEDKTRDTVFVTSRHVYFTEIDKK